MRALVAVVTALSLGGCAHAVRYPAPTIGITAFVLAEGMCEMATEGESLKCLGLSGGIGLGLAGIVALAQLLGGPGDTILMGREGETPASDEPLPVLEPSSPPPEPVTSPVPLVPPTPPTPPPPPAVVEPTPPVPAPIQQPEPVPAPTSP